MKVKHILIFGLATMIFACGPSQERIENERLHQEKIEVGKSINKANLEKILQELRAQLQKEKKELTRINNFQIGRSLSAKEQQLRDQNQKVSKTESFIAGVEKEVSMTNLFNSFDFQLTPKGTVEHIFSSAKNGDFGKLRHLVDPYGEYESAVQRLCLVEMLPSDDQNEWKKIFVNGRIMGDPIIQGDTAEIEVAIGESSKKLEKIKLIKRMDKWFIIGM